MCRAYMTWQDVDEFQILPYSHSGKMTAQICPEDLAPVFIQDGRTIVSRVMRWGFPMQRGKVLFGVEAENIQEKPLFHSAYLYRRCAVPVLGFYESGAQGEYFVLTEKKKNLLYMAGVWQHIGKDDRFVVLTSKYAQGEGGMRVPLLLYADQTIRWLSDSEQAARFCINGTTAQLSATPLKIRA